MKKGLFITFEGNDGCGKTTISTLVMQELQQQSLSVLYTREPGGIGISEQIRDIILEMCIRDSSGNAFDCLVGGHAFFDVALDMFFQ